MITFFNVPGKTNYTAGCYNAWWGNYLQFFIIWDLTKVIKDKFSDYKTEIELINYMRDLTFAYFTLFEFLYPEVAFCETLVYQEYDILE